MANKIGVAIQVDDGGAVKKINGISKAFDKLGGKGSGASLFGNVGAAAVAKGFNLIGDAAGAATGFLEGAVQAAIDDQASNEKLAQALENNITGWKYSTQAISDYVDAQGRLGFSDDEVRDSIGQLVGVTHDATRAMDLNSLAQDLARAKNIDLAQATDIVTKASLGNGKALKGLGIDIGKTKDAAGILDIVQQNVKGSAEGWANTTRGKLQASQVAFNEAVEKIGYQLLPVLSTIMQKFADDWLPALGRGWAKVTAAIKPVADILSHVIGLIGKAIQGIKDFLNWADQLKGQSEFYHPKAPGAPPGHAEGGWVGLQGPELAMVGERGPEYITPNRSNGRSGGGMGVTIQGVSEREIMDMVEKGLFFRLRVAAPTQGRV